MDTALSFPLLIFPCEYSAYLHVHYYSSFFLINVSILLSPIRISVILHVNTLLREALCSQGRARTVSFQMALE